MKAVISLEFIADDVFWAMKNTDFDFYENRRELIKLGPDKSPSSVSLVTGIKNKSIQTKYLKCTRDYSKSNAIGSRGIYGFWILDEGKIYHIVDRYKLNKVRKYFVVVVDGKIKEIEREEVVSCLTKSI